MADYQWAILGMWAINAILGLVWLTRKIDVIRNGPKCENCSTRIVSGRCPNCYSVCLACNHYKLNHRYNGVGCYCGECEAFATTSDYAMAVAKLGEDYFSG